MPGKASKPGSRVARHLMQYGHEEARHLASMLFIAAVIGLWAGRPAQNEKLAEALAQAIVASP